MGQVPALMPDVGHILDGIGFASYVWHLDTDALIWSENAAYIFFEYLNKIVRNSFSDSSQ